MFVSLCRTGFQSSHVRPAPNENGFNITFSRDSAAFFFCSASVALCVHSAHAHFFPAQFYIFVIANVETIFMFETRTTLYVTNSTALSPNACRISTLSYTRLFLHSGPMARHKLKSILCVFHCKCYCTIAVRFSLPTANHQLVTQ